jgi:hypothetical protein
MAPHYHRHLNLSPFFLFALFPFVQGNVCLTVGTKGQLKSLVLLPSVLSCPVNGGRETITYRQTSTFAVQITNTKWSPKISLGHKFSNLGSSLNHQLILHYKKRHSFIGFLCSSRPIFIS